MTFTLTRTSQAVPVAYVSQTSPTCRASHDTQCTAMHGKLRRTQAPRSEWTAHSRPAAPINKRFPVSPAARLSGWFAMWFTAVTSIAGCSIYADLTDPHESFPPGSRFVAASASQGAESQSVLERQQVILPGPTNDKPSAAYHLGANDLLHVNVNGDPKLGTTLAPTLARLIGTRVDGDGRIQLPEVGAVSVAGLTLDQARKRIEERYRVLIKEPWVIVEIIEHRSQPIYLIGELAKPGVIYLDRPTTLVQAVAHGQGLTPRASLRHARLLRDNRLLPVDIYDLLERGDFSQNVWLHANDTLYIPDDRDQQVFVLGKVFQPGQIPMVKGQLTLTQALAGAEGFNKVGSQYDRVRIIRSLSQTRGELIVVDVRAILEGRALPFPLQAGDIVYVPNSPMGNWNDALAEITPTLQAVGAVVSPFAQIAVAATN